MHEGPLVITNVNPITEAFFLTPRHTRCLDIPRASRTSQAVYVWKVGILEVGCRIRASISR